MRIARVVGTVVLNRAHATLQGACLRLVAPLTLEELTTFDGARTHDASGSAERPAVLSAEPCADPSGKPSLAAPASTEPVVAWDELGAGLGSLVALADGPEASQPFYPHVKPIDAYCAAILDQLAFTTD